MAQEQLKGLGGWLIIPIIGLFLSIAILIYHLISINKYSFWFPGGLLSLLYVILLIFSIITLISIFKKKKFVPKLMIFFYATNILVYLAKSLITENFDRIESPIVGGIIWSLYFIYSKRVKNTFVN